MRLQNYKSVPKLAIIAKKVSNGSLLGQRYSEQKGVNEKQWLLLQLIITNQSKVRFAVLSVKLSRKKLLKT